MDINTTGSAPSIPSWHPEAPAPKAKPWYRRGLGIAVIILSVTTLALGGLFIWSLFSLASAHGATGQAQKAAAAATAQDAMLNGSKLVGHWTGSDSAGWTGTLAMTSGHSFTFASTDGSQTVSGTWSVYGPGQILMVEPQGGDNGDLGLVDSYTLSNDGHSLVIVDHYGDGHTVTNTFTKLASER